MAAAPEARRDIGRVAPALHWRIYDDGVVVMVPATCEIHVLHVELGPLFNAGTLVISDAMQAELLVAGSADWTPQAVVLQEPLFAHLARLQIIERLPAPQHPAPCRH
jgi:hypothetical protein